MSISNDTLKLAFAFNLNKRIKNMSITNKQFAEMTGVSEITISNYMTGKYLPRYEHVIVFANILNCTPNDLMDISDEIIEKAINRRKYRQLK